MQHPTSIILANGIWPNWSMEVIGMMRCRAACVNSGRRAVKLTALAVCALFVLVILLSSVFILANADHKHDHKREDGGCATCANIVICAKLIRHLGAAITAAAAITGMAGFVILPRFATPQVYAVNLISLKVRLNI